jgi:hypothetical protein
MTERAGLPTDDPWLTENGISAATRLADELSIKLGRRGTEALLTDVEAAGLLGIATSALRDLCRHRLVEHYRISERCFRFDAQQLKQMRSYVDLIRAVGGVPEIERIRAGIEFGTPTRVYFIRAGRTGPIKIGHAAYPEGRLRDLQCAHFQELILLGHVAGRVPVESAIHNRFKHLRMSGEWFRPTKTLIRFIDQTLDLEARLAEAAT